MVKLGLVATSGQTEIGGLQAFLQKIPNLQIERLFPAARKPKRGARVQVKGQAGATGRHLLRLAEERLRQFGAPDVNGLLFVDDADCRFSCCEQLGYQEFIDEVVTRLRDAVNDDSLPIFVLLASPEIEAWILADAGHPGAALDRWLRTTDPRGATHALAEAGLQKPPQSWESFGCPIGPDGASCTTKLGDELKGAVRRLGRRRGYSKWLDGQDLLRQLDPQRVANNCPLYAGPALESIRMWASAPKV